MKLSEHYRSHGLEVVVASKQSGERIHLRFDKGQTRIPCTFSGGGHHSEAAFELREVESTGEYDMAVVLVVASKPGGVLPPTHAKDGSPASPMKLARDLPANRIQPVSSTRMEVAPDGAPMLPTGPAKASVAATGVAADPVQQPLGKLSALRDPNAEVVDSESTRAIVAGSSDPSRMGQVSVAPQRVRLPHEVHVKDHDDHRDPDPTTGSEYKAEQAEHAALIEKSKAMYQAAPEAPVAKPEPEKASAATETAAADAAPKGGTKGGAKGRR